MKKIAVLGAGRSASTLIKYLLQQAAVFDWQVTVGDQDLELAQSKIGKDTRGKAIVFNAQDELIRKQTITEHDVVISMLPPALHDLVAMNCIGLKKHLITASYVSKTMEHFDADAKRAGILMMCEMGLDPGIDHMSAMKIIDEVKKDGGVITAFKSYCGGLIAPASDDNPWSYKFTWNPRNVVLAGQGVAQYIENGKDKFIPYNQLFSRIETMDIKGHGKFEAYANRDSLSYIDKYGLKNIPTILRATLRRDGYCKSWDAFVQLGLTDDTYTIPKSEELTYAQWIESYLPVDGKKESLKKRLANYLFLKKSSEVIEKIEWLGLFDNNKIKLKEATPAQILQQLLEKKWKIKKSDKDMVIMRHLFEYKKGKKNFVHTSTMVLKGSNSIDTAMAKTVGLPLGIMAKQLLTTDVKTTGVHIPVLPEIYEPVLKELKEYGIYFTEEVTQ